MTPANLRPGLLRVLLLSLVALALLLARNVYTGTGTFRFLAWNLGLAWIPYLLGLCLPLVDGEGAARRLARGTLLLGWLAFLPNAPYVITDLIHLKARPPVPVWYDATMLAMFGLAGLLLGVYALAMVERRVALRWGGLAGWLMAATAAGLCGVGIMIGRFERWNSWDIATNPRRLIADLAPLLDPLGNPRAWAASLIFGACTYAIYLGLRPTEARA